MKIADAKLVHINDCIRDDELDLIEAITEAAEPGKWILREGLRDEGIGPVVTRYSGAPVTSEASLRFMAEARGYVPRLLRGIRATRGRPPVYEDGFAGNFRGWMQYRKHIPHESNFAQLAGASLGPSVARFTKAVDREIAMWPTSRTTDGEPLQVIERKPQ